MAAKPAGVGGVPMKGEQGTVPRCTVAEGIAGA